MHFRANGGHAVRSTNLAGEVKLNGFDTNVGGTGGHDCCSMELVWKEQEVEGVGEEGRSHRFLSTVDELPTRQRQGAVK